MALTKDQRYLFCMEEGESKAWLAKKRLMQVVGAIVLLSVSLMVGRIVLAGYQFLMPAFLEEIQVNGLVVFGYVFVLGAAAMAIYGIAASICSVFGISSSVLGVLSGVLVVAPLLFFLIDSSGPPDIVTLVTLPLFAFLGVIQNEGTYAIVSREKRRKKACAAIADVNSPNDLADIVVQSEDDECVRTAWDRICALMAAQPKDEAPLLRIAEGARSGAIRSKACDMAGHDWNGCRCERCDETRDEHHDWDGCICTRCGKTRDESHSWNGCTCTRCGKQHDFNTNKVCSICGGALVDETIEMITYETCTGCPSGSGYGCTGDTATCIASEDYRHFEYETVTYIVYPDGTKKQYEGIGSSKPESA